MFEAFTRNKKLTCTCILLYIFLWNKRRGKWEEKNRGRNKKWRKVSTRKEERDVIRIRMLAINRIEIEVDAGETCSGDWCRYAGCAGRTIRLHLYTRTLDLFRLLMFPLWSSRGKLVYLSFPLPVSLNPFLFTASTCLSLYFYNCIGQ